MFKFKYNSLHLKYLEETGQNVKIYSEASEFEYSQVKAFVPIQPKVIMDLGCGLGRSSVYLNHILNRVDTHFILADSADNFGNWNNKDYYKNLDLTASFCTLNGLLNFGLFDLKKSDWNGILNIEFIMSKLSYGYSINIGPILETLLKVSTDDITMIFGTKERQEMLPMFENYFKEVIYLKEEKQESFPQQDWLILRGKK
jgi:hypothetical protein